MATQMLALGTDVTTVSKRLGHATTATTLRTYAHFVPERDRDAAEGLGALI
jgi:integrase